MTQTHTTMGMPAELEVHHTEAKRWASEIFAWFDWVDHVFSTYKAESEISRLARGELGLEQSHPLVRDVLDECERLEAMTGGAFSAHPNGTLDPSGLVKGWAIERAARYLEREGARDYRLEIAGDIQVGGRSPDGGHWKIGIRHPYETGRFAKILHVSDCAVATSGTYERGGHIYDPRTGRPVTGTVSLTVVGPRLGRTDALATAAFVMGRDGLTFLASQGYEAMMITTTQEVIMTPGFRRFEAPPRRYR